MGILFLILSTIIIGSLYVYIKMPKRTVWEVKEYTNKKTLVLKNKDTEMIIRNYPNSLEKGMIIRYIVDEYKGCNRIDESFAYFGKDYIHVSNVYQNISIGENILVYFKKNNKEENYSKTLFGKIKYYDYDTIIFEDEKIVEFESIEYIDKGKERK